MDSAALEDGTHQRLEDSRRWLLPYGRTAKGWQAVGPSTPHKPEGDLQ